MLKRNIFCMCAIALLQGMVFYAPVATLYRRAAGVSVEKTLSVAPCFMLMEST